MAGFTSGIPFGNQVETKNSAVNRLGPRASTVGGAAKVVGQLAKANARKYQQEAQGDFRSEFSRMRAQDAELASKKGVPGSVEVWRDKAFGNRPFHEDFVPPGGDVEPAIAAKNKPNNEEVA